MSVKKKSDIVDFGFRYFVSLNSLCLEISNFLIEFTPPHPNFFWKPITDMARKDTQIIMTNIF